MFFGSLVVATGSFSEYLESDKLGLLFFWRSDCRFNRLGGLFSKGLIVVVVGLKLI
jgi:hypothetical protein